MTRLSRQLATSRPFLADGGLETSLIFHDGIDLPSFAAFPLLRTELGRAALARYFERHLRLAREAGTGFVLDTATWRAGTSWRARLGWTEAAIRGVSGEAVRFAQALRARFETAETPILVNGVVGPSGDGYAVGQELSPVEAEAAHRPQVEALARAGADLVTAVTMTHSGEAIGVVRAAVAAGVPVAASFTVETDGRLPSGEALSDAADAVVDATGDAVLYVMVNCAHPTHIARALGAGEAWAARIGGLRANASTLSHAELDEAPELDEGDPADLGQRYRARRHALPGLRVLGGCCGTDHRHVEAIRDACLPAA